MTFGGPYIIAHQDTMVRADDSRITKATDLEGKRICQAAGSNSYKRITDPPPDGQLDLDAQLVGAANYSECVAKLAGNNLDAVTTDDLILAGFAKQGGGNFKILGDPFTDEKYGVGLKKGDIKTCEAVNTGDQEDVQRRHRQAAARQVVRQRRRGCSCPPRPRLRRAAPDRPLTDSRVAAGARLRVTGRRRTHRVEHDGRTDQIRSGPRRGLSAQPAARGPLRGLLADPRHDPGHHAGGADAGAARRRHRRTSTSCGTPRSRWCWRSARSASATPSGWPSPTTPITNSFWLVVLGLSAYTATFVCEALRSGINTVPLGQAEAARAIGLTFFQSLRLVILPQAFRVGHRAARQRDDRDDQEHHGGDRGRIPRRVGLRHERHLRRPPACRSRSSSGSSAAFMAVTLPIGFFTGWLAKRMAVAR